MSTRDRDAGDGRRRPAGRGGLSVGSPLLGGPLPDPASPTPPNPLHGAGQHARSDAFDMPRPASPAPRRASGASPVPADPGRAIDDWGRSERTFELAQPLLDFYYRYWFRVEQHGVERVPSTGGALLVANHSGALPPDAPMIMQAIRNEHPRSRPLYILGEDWFRGYPLVGMLANKIGLVPAHPENAQRLLGDEGRLALVFPEGQKGSRKLYWQRYRLRRFGRGGFVRTAIRAGVPIVPVAVVGAEEAMPIFAHVRSLERLTGLIYFPVNHAFPHFGLAAGLMYMPAKFRISFLDPVPTDGYGPAAADDLTLVQSVAEDVRGRIQREVDKLVASRTSVWFG